MSPKWRQKHGLDIVHIAIRNVSGRRISGDNSKVKKSLGGKEVECACRSLEAPENNLKRTMLKEMSTH